MTSVKTVVFTSNRPPDGGIVVLDDSTIYDMAVEILPESKTNNQPVWCFNSGTAG